PDPRDALAEGRARPQPGSVSGTRPAGGAVVVKKFNRVRCIRIGFVLALLGALSLGTAFTPAFGQSTGRNPTADSVHEEALFKQSSKIQGTITIPDWRASVLEQPRGQDWRGFHEGTMPWIAGIAVVGMVLLLTVFFLVRGRIRLEPAQYIGRKILRFNAFERFAHWLTAICYNVLDLSALNYFYSKRLLQPVLGHEAFTTLSQWSKYAHNFLAWPFMLGILLMFALWVAHNIPNRIDWLWFKAGGGIVGSGHPH